MIRFYTSLGPQWECKVSIKTFIISLLSRKKNCWRIFSKKTIITVGKFKYLTPMIWSCGKEIDQEGSKWSPIIVLGRGTPL